MPSFFAIFSGLGSESLFSQEHLEQAERDTTTPECAVLLQSCHRAFFDQIADAVDRGIIGESAIDLTDFAEPMDLLHPAPKYHQNVIVQHTVLYLQQSMRYLAIRQELGALAGSAGFCTGLLPAAVATTGGESLVSRISRAQDFFQVALAIGIRSEEYRSNHLARELINVDNTAHSCSYVVDGLCGEAVAELLARANMVCF